MHFAGGSRSRKSLKYLISNTPLRTGKRRSHLYLHGRLRAQYRYDQTNSAQTHIVMMMLDLWWLSVDKSFVHGSVALTVAELINRRTLFVHRTEYHRLAGPHCDSSPVSPSLFVHHEGPLEMVGGIAGDRPTTRVSQWRRVWHQSYHSPASRSTLRSEQTRSREVRTKHVTLEGTKF